MEIYIFSQIKNNYLNSKKSYLQKHKFQKKPVSQNCFNFTRFYVKTKAYIYIFASAVAALEMYKTSFFTGTSKEFPVHTMEISQFSRARKLNWNPERANRTCTNDKTPHSPDRQTRFCPRTHTFKFECISSSVKINPSVH